MHNWHFQLKSIGVKQTDTSMKFQPAEISNDAALVESILDFEQEHYLPWWLC